ncbi:ankyrin repeat domain-containing protein 26-like [Apodemus sylvaticus]|uniref:ankyrin repeat domain-containing protein 26-like n=1 Tax=Apodemus sylvaticus TaxID=10129 RepID=UPI002243E8E2|nr:ankyrin repeat domain-containing protein 26-like [Apodemus sylvaticus]XP_052040626.1 ankyrin repeat domain-containing protein 26-like [Apodemus sylvaticus]
MGGRRLGRGDPGLTASRAPSSPERVQPSAPAAVPRMDENYNLLPHGVNFQDAIFPDTQENRRMFSVLFQFANCSQGQQLTTSSSDWEIQEDNRASQFKHEECVAMLLEHGADPNAIDDSGNTALHYAVWHNSTSMTAKLLAHNADFSIKNEESFTPLTLARMKNDNLAKLLEDQKEKIKELDELERSSKKTSNEKEEVKEQGNHMLDLKELISCEGNSKDCEQYSCDTILHFIEELMRQRKDINSEILVKIWGAVYTYKRSIDFEKHNCELIEEDCERISNEIIALREEWSQLEIENAELQDELCSLRATLENLELNDAASLQAEENEELSRTPVQEEQFKLYLSLTQSLHEMRRRNSELEEEIDRYMDLCTMMEEDSDAHQNGEFSGYNASSTSHCEEDTVLKLREKLESMETKLQQELIRCQCKEDEINLWEQKIAERTAARENREAEEGRIKQLEEKILSLKADMDKNMVERSEVENHKKAIEEQARSQLMEKINQENQVLRELAASEQQKDQERQDYIMSLEHRYKEIELEIVETKSRAISVKAQRRTFEEKYRAELQLEERLKYELENIYRSIVELQNTKSRLSSERRMNRLSHIHTQHRSVSEGTSDSSLQNIFGFNSIGATI